jgi:Kef-type K+ transport system membrane component KefB
MTSLDAVPTLVLIAAIAVVSPLIAELTKRFGIPEVVIQILLGMAIGPYALKLAHPGDVVNALSDLGLGFLMFLAGSELDLHRVRGLPLRLGLIGWGISLVLALGAAFTIVSVGLGLDTVVIGLALTTTAIGTLIPMIRDAGVLDTKFGSFMLAAGSVGEFIPIVAVALLLTEKDPALTVALLAAFVAIAVAAALLATRAHPPKLVELLSRHLNSATQLPVRVAVLLVLLLTYLALELGLDVLLGAFTAGIVVRLFIVGKDSEIVRGKLEAIGFGFLVPIFFIVSGVNFDIHAFVEKPSTLLRIPLFLGLFLIVRGTPALLLYRKVLSASERIAFALLSATGLPLIVVITSIGVAEQKMRPDNAAALVGAGLLSVVLLPMLALRRLRSVSPDQEAGPAMRAPG